MEQAIHHRTVRQTKIESGWAVPPDTLPADPSLSLATQTARVIYPQHSANLLPLVAARLRTAPLEECHFLFYSGAEPVGHQWFAGEHDRVEIDTREMFHHALNQGATRMIIAHNHPSGNPSPSRTDVQFTTNIISIGKALRVLAFDHVIFARDRHFSFRSEGLM